MTTNVLGFFMNGLFKMNGHQQIIEDRTASQPALFMHRMMCSLTLSTSHVGAFINDLQLARERVWRCLGALSFVSGVGVRVKRSIGARLTADVDEVVASAVSASLVMH